MRDVRRAAGADGTCQLSSKLGARRALVAPPPPACRHISRTFSGGYLSIVGEYTCGATPRAVAVPDHRPVVVGVNIAAGRVCDARTSSRIGHACLRGVSVSGVSASGRRRHRSPYEHCAQRPTRRLGRVRRTKGLVCVGSRVLLPVISRRKCGRIQGVLGPEMSLGDSLPAISACQGFASTTFCVLNLDVLGGQFWAHKGLG